MKLQQLLDDLQHDLLSGMPAGQATVLQRDLSLHSVCHGLTWLQCLLGAFKSRYALPLQLDALAMVHLGSSSRRWISGVILPRRCTLFLLSQYWGMPDNGNAKSPRATFGCAYRGACFARVAAHSLSDAL